MLKLKHLPGLVFLATGLTHAHLKATSLLPMGGETLSIGQSVSITWTVEETHAKGIDIAFSKDGGTTWTNIKTGYADTEKEDKFNWTVPTGMATTQGKFRICQSGPCTNAHNVSKPGGAAPWVLVSGAFTVQAATGILAPSGNADGLSVDFNPASRNVDVSFALAEAGAVLLQAFDMQGRLVANLIQGNYAAGSHNLSVFSNRLGHSGSLVFKLQAGTQAKTHTWMSLR